ncbi:MAG TPA: hypothetical protein VK468_02100, partial [Pyrinomonadaceae bacterium]|nr:hypothetical protein [Pyrinomonadaceae bacterium]
AAARKIPSVVYFVSAAAVLIAFLIGAYYFMSRGGHQPVIVKQSTFQNPAIMVLPFQSDDPSSQSLGAGLADALTSKLGNIKSLQVISANTGRLVAGSDPVKAAQGLDVAFLLRGQLSKSLGRSVLTADLVNAGTDSVIWTQDFTADDGDLFALQTQLAEKVWTSLNIVPLPLERQQLYKSYTHNNEAYEYYLIGQYQMANRSRENLRKAIDTFSHSLAADPGFALAYVGVADAYALLNLYDIEAPRDAYDKARENAEKALAIDDDLAEAHASLAYVKFYHQRDRAGAELEFRRAIQLNPSYAQAHHWFALVLTAMGRYVEGLSEAQIAQRLDPRSPSIKAATAIVYFMSGQNAEALAECDKALAIDSSFVPALKVRRWVYSVAGDSRNAFDSFQKELTYSGGQTDDPGWKLIEMQLPNSGTDSKKASAEIEKATSQPIIQQNPAAFSYEAALAYNAHGATDKSLDWLERCEASDSYSFNLIAVDPRLANLRSEPRFQRLLGKLKP